MPSNGEEPTPPQTATLPKHDYAKREGEEKGLFRSPSSRFGRSTREAGEVGSSGLEVRIALGLLLLTLFFSSLPYLLGYFSAPPGTRFIGTVYNIDDYCNYLSWLRQTMDGRFFFHNLFTTDPQIDREFNVFFWTLGRAAHFLHWSPQAIFQLARLVGGAALLWLLWRLCRYCLSQSQSARLTAFGFLCGSSGLGWTTWRHWQDKNGGSAPVDAWQPEAFTFLSLYTSPLFVVSTLLIVGALYALLLGEETGRWKYPVVAGLCGAVLGNMHSYDVLHLSAAWGLFLLAWTAYRRGRGVALSWARGVLALGLTLPTTLYQYYIFKADAVFHKRAEVPTPSPTLPVLLHLRHAHLLLHLPVVPYISAYGIVFALAVVVVIVLARKRESPLPPVLGEPEGKETGSFPIPPELGARGFFPFRDTRTALFAACWAVGGFVAAYLPFAFQRKMLMGEHVPLCLLAGAGAAWLARRLAPRWPAVALVLIVLATVPSNFLFLRRDVHHLEENRSETALTPYLTDTLMDVYRWIRTSTPSDAAVVGVPALCTPLPGETGRAVWAGHWGETPAYAGKQRAFARFAEAGNGLAPWQRAAFLAATRAGYFFYPNDARALDYTSKSGVTHHFVDFAASPLPNLSRVYANKDYTVFRINTGR